jgi:hypothetical protein
MGQMSGIVRRASFRRGVRDGDRLWLTVWAVMAASTWVRQKIGRTQQLVYRTELLPGERLEITHEDRPVGGGSRRQRRRAGRAGDDGGSEPAS